MQKCTQLLLCLVLGYACPAQVLTLKQAVATALANYPTVKAKANYVRSGQATLQESRREYLPNLVATGQQDYGTVNGQDGPLYSYEGFEVASSGPVLPENSGTSAFGALYVGNVNWDFFAFGRAVERVRVARSLLRLDSGDLGQEEFEQEVRVAGAYLNLLAAQRLILTQKSNFDRAQYFQGVVLARVKGQLNPGVDSSEANAEVSSAKIALTNAIDFAETKANALAQLMGVPARDFVLDSFFIAHIPASFEAGGGTDFRNHPLLQFYRSRVELSQEQAKYLKTLSYPVFTLFGVVQGRGSGFADDYGATNPDAYSHSYWQGVGVQRSNYVVGIGVTWNLTGALRVRKLVEAQKFQSLGLENEYDLIDQRLAAERALAGTKIKNAMDNYREAPIQVRAAADAFMQKSVLYKNGLATIVDVTQTLFELNQAETNRDVAFNNVWQALLLKAAATGDWNLFNNEF